MHALVIGDMILDEYRYVTDQQRPNTEAEGKIYEVSKIQYYLGGAGAVARILRGFGCEVTLAYHAKTDMHGQLVSAQCRELGVVQACCGEQVFCPTTVKMRFVDSNGLLPHRFDFDANSHLTPAAVSSWFAGVMHTVDLIVIADYGKGVCVPEAMEEVCRYAHCPVYVQLPKHGNWRPYVGARYCQCNQAEWIAYAKAHAISQDEGGSPARYVAALQRSEAIVTYGGAGLKWCDQKGLFGGIVAREPTHVTDCCGAGDTILATVAVLCTAGMRLRDAAKQATAIAAEQVAHLGVQAISLPARLRKLTERIGVQSRLE